MSQLDANQEFNLYRDISQRTGGEIYVGVVGPVRTGKSTFIKRFMDLMVLPQIENEHERVRTQDELPQSSGGRTITTTEPKFIPKEAAQIDISDGINVKVRLIDCVGYMVEGAAGHMEEDAERMVKTPWSREEIPFTQAAEIGTRKVIKDHSTIGIVVTTDGSFGEIPRNAYKPAEEQTITELKALGKPFVVLVNTTKPYADEAKEIAAEIEKKYIVKAIPINIEQLRRDDITMILEQVMYEFPVSVIEFYTPKWMDIMDIEKPMKKEVIDVTLPAKKNNVGHRHPNTIALEEVERIFIGMGYEVVEGPEVKKDYYNFEALNIPADHPAKDEQDTFYITGDILLRTQTSSTQVHEMEKGRLPIRMIAPGRVFRSDEVDATHSPSFHQIEGLVIDRNITFADLKGTLAEFAKELFGEETKVKFRPHHFPFTEPSAEMDVTCFKCGGKGCRFCKGEGWIEILGCGMVHPHVLEMSGIDPEKYTGFAFGVGLERIALLKYEIDDMRLLYENDVRFLRQF